MKHIGFYLDLIAKVGSHVYLIPDGKPPEAKSKVLEERKQRQEKYKTPFKSPEIVREILDKYRNNPKFTIIDAPQEADSQLAFMSLSKLVDFIITEDSDLILYGCDRILYKLKPSGSCYVYKREKIENFIQTFNWDFHTFKLICILCGCDYFPGIRGLGLVSATKIFTKPIESEFELKQFLTDKYQMTDSNFEHFLSACQSYTHQLVQSTDKIGSLHELLAY